MKERQQMAAPIPFQSTKNDSLECKHWQLEVFGKQKLTSAEAPKTLSEENKDGFPKETQTLQDKRIFVVGSCIFEWVMWASDLVWILIEAHQLICILVDGKYLNIFWIEF